MIRVVKFRNISREKNDETLLDFYSISKSKEPDITIKTNHKYIIDFLRDYGNAKKLYRIHKRFIELNSDDLFERIIIYASILYSLKDDSKRDKVKRIIRNLNGYEVHFWASTFAEFYRINRSIKSILRPARAFKILYNLVK
ncbi:MAG: hypothetical protein ACP6IQ_07485 [Candidatus Njordarchaeia archaeon]